MEDPKQRIIPFYSSPLPQALRSSQPAQIDETHGRIQPKDGTPVASGTAEVEVSSVEQKTQPVDLRLLFSAVVNLLQSAWDFQQSLTHILYHAAGRAGVWLSFGPSPVEDASQLIRGFFESEGVPASVKKEPLPREIQKLKYGAVVLGVPILNTGTADLRQSPALGTICRGLGDRQIAVATLARRCLSQEVAKERLALQQRLNTIAFAAQPVEITEELNETGRTMQETQARQVKQDERTKSLSGSLENSASAELNNEASLSCNPLLSAKSSLKVTSSVKLTASGSVGWRNAMTSDEQERNAVEQGTGQRLMLKALRPAHPWAEELKAQLEIDIARLAVPQCWDVAQLFLVESEADLPLLVQQFRSHVPFARGGYVIPLRSLHDNPMTNLPAIADGDTRRDLALRLTYQELARILCFPL